MSVTRRHFLQGCCAGIVAMSGVKVGNLAFAQSPGASGPNDMLIAIFLRGGMDSMSFLVPHGEANYHTSRARLAMNSSQVLDLDGRLGLHPSAARLKELMDNGHAGIVCACGSPDPTRSHFDAQYNMERGKLSDRKFSGGGWLARQISQYADGSIFQAVSRGASVATSLEGFGGALAIEGAQGFTLSGSSGQKDDVRRALRGMYAADPALGQVAISTLEASDLIEYTNPSGYTPPNGTAYPNTGLANALASLAQMIRLEMGLQVATVDFGGWDTHESQADSGNPQNGYFANQIQQLCDALHAFWSDLTEFHDRLTVVVMSEFGRRLKENSNRGTDHGHGSVMTVLSGNLTRGGVFGEWPGLAPDSLYEGVDLQVTTDYRTVLGEILTARTPTRHLGSIFPGFALDAPVGLFPARASLSRGAGLAWMGME